MYKRQLLALRTDKPLFLCGIHGAAAHQIVECDNLSANKDVYKRQVLHPASETHRQLTDEQLVAAGIDAGMVRLSVGLENVNDILDDLKEGFAGI